MTSQSGREVQLEVEPGHSGQSLSVVGHDGGQGGEEVVHQHHVVLQPEDGLHLRPEMCLQLVMTEDEVLHHLFLSPSLGRGLTSDRGDQSGEVRKVIYSPKAVVFARLEESDVVGARNVSQVWSVR